MTTVLIDSYISQLKTCQTGDPWYGDSFTAKLTGLTEKDAFKKPSDLHSVAELVWHCTYWHTALIKTVQDNDYPKPGALQWASNDKLIDKGFDKIKEELFQSYHNMIVELKNLTDSDLQTIYKYNYTFQYLIEGVIQHDVYHIGQIGIVRKLVKSRT